MASAAAKNTKTAEFLGVVSFALSLMVLISVATYNPGDPVPFFKAGASGPVRNFIGPIGAFLAELLIPQLFGVAALLVPLVLGITGWKLFWCRPIDAPYTKAAGLSLLLVSLTAFLTLTFGAVTIEGEPVRAGGAAGQLAAAILTASFNRTGAYIVVATSLFVALILATQFSFASFLGAVAGRLGARLSALRTAWAHYRETRRKEKMRREVIRKHTQKDPAEPSGGLPRVRRVRNSDPAVDEDEEDEVEVEHPPAPRPAPAQKPLPFAGPEPDLDLQERPRPSVRKKRAASSAVPDPTGNSAVPPIVILDEPKPSISLDNERLYEKGRILQAKCGEFGVMGTVKEIHPGPVVTTYEFKPDAGVKYSKIVGLSDDLALALEAESIRIDRVSGKGNVGIEIPNEVRDTIYLREMLESDAFRKAPGRLTLALGKTVNGDPWVTDLAAMPHLLIAGSTGTGTCDDWASPCPSCPAPPAPQHHSVPVVPAASSRMPQVWVAPAASASQRFAIWTGVLRSCG